MATTTQSIKKQLEPGLNAIFGMMYKQHPKEWAQVFESKNSKKRFEEDVLESGFGFAPLRDEGAAVHYDEAQEEYTVNYTHVELAMGFRITQQAVEDGLYGDIGAKRSAALGRAMAQSEELIHANLFNLGFTDTGPDGVALFSASHPTRNGNQSNTLATPADLSETSIEQLAIQIRKAKDSRGLPVMLRTEGLILPPDLEYEGLRLTKSVLRPGTADNDVNAMVAKGLFMKAPVIMTHLTDPDAWFIKTDCPDGLKHFTRIAMDRKMTGDFETDDVKYRARQRFSRGYSDWRGVYGSAGAA